MTAPNNYIITDRGETRKVERSERWTKQCADGRACERYDGNPASRSFVADDQTICDACLIARFGLADHGTCDALDHLGMFILYPEEHVIRALRLACAGKEDEKWAARQERIKSLNRAREAERGET